jgi:hypothetical protein
VTRGFAGLKFSGSPRRFGLRSVKRTKALNRIRIPARSLIVKYGWKGILSVSLFVPIGLLDPV